MSSQEHLKYSLFIGRWQAPSALHAGHKALIDTVLAEGKRVCIAVRDTPIDSSNPLSVVERVALIRQYYPDQSRVLIIVIPDIEAVCFGRDVGYDIRRIHLSQEVESISATELREEERVFLVSGDDDSSPPSPFTG